MGFRSGCPFCIFLLNTLDKGLILFPHLFLNPKGIGKFHHTRCCPNLLRMNVHKRNQLVERLPEDLICKVCASVKRDGGRCPCLFYKRSCPDSKLNKVFCSCEKCCIAVENIKQSYNTIMRKGPDNVKEIAVSVLNLRLEVLVSVLN